MKAMLIINPIAGSRHRVDVAKFVNDRLTPLGWQIEVRLTTAAGDATAFAAEAAEKGYDAVLTAGGDGTVNETASALCDKNVALGILPCGSGNGLARHAGIPMGVAGACEVISRRHVEAIDYATVDGRPFFCTFGVGFDAEVSHRFAMYKRRGLLTYLRSTFETFTRFEPERYTLRSGDTVLTRQALLVAVCNASQYGNNAYIAPQASVLDGLLDVTIVHVGNALSTALVGVDLLTGYIDRNTLIETMRTRTLTIERKSPGPAHIDGEPVRLGRKIEIECHPGGLRVFTPQKETKFAPIITPMTSAIADVRSRIDDIMGS